MPLSPLAREEEETSAGRPQPSKVEKVRSYFGESRNYLDIRRYVIEIRKETVQEFIGQRTFDRILDIGCGDGSVTLPLLSPHTRLTLLDISSSMLAKAMSKIPPDLLPNVKTVNEDFMSVPLEPGSYDLITCIGVLAHVDSPSAVIARTTSLLRPGGLLVLECTDASHFSNRLMIRLSWLGRLLVKPSGYSSNLISADSVIRAAREQGLTPLSEYRHNLALPLMRRFLSQSTLQRMVRLIFGSSKRNRNAWLGKECLFLFAKNAA
jgi:2-polyprenyl-3-methyl-5-hydroxy-6-metoxy-1,4-benzoquinol methylase